MDSATLFSGYWSFSALSTNLVIFLNLSGALALGLMVGYERSYHGRAAGMRTYGLVCTASCALTVIAGYPGAWFGGHGVLLAGGMSPDPTRVIQGVVTGIGFLGAGVIMKEGFSISGLTTAASIWSAAAIGVMVGVGFYAAAMLLTLLSALCMTLVARLESWLPSRPALAVSLRFRPGYIPTDQRIESAAGELGYRIAWGSLRIDQVGEQITWHFVAINLQRGISASVPRLAAELGQTEGVEEFNLSHARN